MGFDYENTHEHIKRPLDLVMTLAEYGTSAQLWSGQSRNIKKAMRAAKDVANAAKMMFGFMMDQPRNGFGATGWDLIRGNVWGDAEERMNRNPVDEIVDLLKTQPPYIKAMYRVLAPLKNRTSRLKG
jgi:hypothetical protein